MKSAQIKVKVPPAGQAPLKPGRAKIEPGQALAQNRAAKTRTQGWAVPKGAPSTNAPIPQGVSGSNAQGYANWLSRAQHPKHPGKVLSHSPETRAYYNNVLSNYRSGVRDRQANHILTPQEDTADNAHSLREYGGPLGSVAGHLTGQREENPGETYGGSLAMDALTVANPALGMGGRWMYNTVTQGIPNMVLAQGERINRTGAAATWTGGWGNSALANSGNVPLKDTLKALPNSLEGSIAAPFLEGAGGAIPGKIKYLRPIARAQRIAGKPLQYARAALNTGAKNLGTRVGTVMARNQIGYNLSAAAGVAGGATDARRAADDRIASSSAANANFLRSTYGGDPAYNYKPELAPHNAGIDMAGALMPLAPYVLPPAARAGTIGLQRFTRPRALWSSTFQGAGLGYNRPDGQAEHFRAAEDFERAAASAALAKQRARQ